MTTLTIKNNLTGGKNKSAGTIMDQHVRGWCSSEMVFTCFYSLSLSVGGRDL